MGASQALEMLKGRYKNWPTVCLGFGKANSNVLFRRKMIHSFLIDYSDSIHFAVQSEFIKKNGRNDFWIAPLSSRPFVSVLNLRLATSVYRALRLLSVVWPRVRLMMAGLRYLGLFTGNHVQ